MKIIVNKMCISKVFQNYFTFCENNEKNIETKKTIEIKEKTLKILHMDMKC